MRLTDPSWLDETVRRELRVVGQEVSSKVEHHPHRGFSFHHTRPALFADHANSHAGFLDNAELHELGIDELHEDFHSFLSADEALVTTVGPLGEPGVESRLWPLLEVLGEATSRRAWGPRPASLGEARRYDIGRIGGSPFARAVTYPVLSSAGTTWSRTLAVHQVLAAALGQLGAHSLVAVPPEVAVTARVGINTDVVEDRSPSCLTVSGVAPVAPGLVGFAASVGEALADDERLQDPMLLTRARSFVQVGVARKVENGVARARVAAWLRLFCEQTVDGYVEELATVTGEEIVAAARALRDHGGREIWL